MCSLHLNLDRYFWLSFVMSLAGASIYLFAPTYVQSTEHTGLDRVMPFMVIAYWLLAVASNCAMAFIGFGLAWLSALQRICGSLIFLVGVMAIDPGTGLIGIVGLQILQGIVVCAFGLFVFYGYVARGLIFSLWSRQKMGGLAEFGAKLLAVSAVQSLAEPIIKLLVGHFASLSAIAVLEVATRLIQGLRGLVLSAGQLIVTYFAKICGYDSLSASTHVKGEYETISRAIVSGSLASFAVLFSCAPLAEFIFFPPDLATQPPNLFPVILIGFGLAWLSNSMVSAGYFLLVALRKTPPLLIIELIKTSMLVVLGYCLGHLFGLAGLLTAVIAAFMGSSVYLFVAAARQLNYSPKTAFMSTFGARASPYYSLCWALGFLIIWMIAPTTFVYAVTTTNLMSILIYFMAPFVTVLLIVFFGGLRHLAHVIMVMKP